MNSEKPSQSKGREVLTLGESLNLLNQTLLPLSFLVGNLSQNQQVTPEEVTPEQAEAAIQRIKDELGIDITPPKEL